MFSVRPHRTTSAVGAALLAALALTACAGGEGNDSSAAGSVAGPGVTQGGGSADESGRKAADAPVAGGDSAKPASGSGSTGAGGVTQANLVATQDQLARRATIALQVKNIGQAVAKVRATTATAEGIVLSENIGTVDSDIPLREPAKVTATTYGEITISVPSTKLDSVLAALASVGTVIRSTSSSENVGAQIVDTQSRLETMRVSVERVRKFLQEAKDLSQIVALEAELTRRQADLESLEAQLASLKGSVARSPIQISLTTEPGAIVDDADDAGFLAGLRAGWKAFTASATTLLTVLGAMLPFLVLLALLATPVGWYLRRRRAMTPPPAVLPQ